MDFLPIDIDDEWWLKFFQWLSILAIIISFVGAYCTTVFSDRATKKMQGEIAKSNEMAAKSNEVAATANERAEELKAENLKLGLQLEKERQARLLIERRLAPRFLSAEEQKIITEAIRPYSEHRISINGNGDPEAELYADQFVRLFESVKWQVVVAK